MANEYLINDCAGIVSLNINESAKGGVCRFQGKFQEANTVNKNKRRYSESVLRSNVDRLQDAIKNRSLLMALDHPSDSILRLETAAALTTDLYFEGNILMGTGEVLNTPNGLILRNLLESGVRVGVSSRGVGSGTTNEHGVLEINDNYRLLCFDLVCDPSTFNSFINDVEYTKSSHTPSYRSESAIPLLKNENKSINKVNVNTIISYFGHLVDNKTKLLKEGLNND